MNKNYLFILILLFGNDAFSQTEIFGEYCRLAEGIFCNIQKDDKCITFQPNHQFYFYNKYDFTGTGYAEYGRGRYTISKDTLTLSFADKDPNFVNSYSIQKTINPTSDSILIDIQLYYLKDTTPLSFADVYIKDSVSLNNNRNLGGFSTDIHGRGHKTIAKYSSTFWLEISLVFVPVSLVELSNDFDYTITGYLVTDDEGCIYGEERKYLILTNKNKLLRIKNLTDKEISLLQLYE